MKRLLAALLAAALAGSLAACGGEPAREPAPPVSSMELPANRKPRRPRQSRSPRPAPESAPGEAPPAGSVPAAEAVSTPPAAPAAALPDGFNFTIDPDNPEGYVIGGVRQIGETIYRYSDQVAVGGDWRTAGYLRELSPVLDDEIGERLSDIDVLTVDMEDDTRYAYTFYTEGLEVAKSLPAADAGEPVRYRVDPEAYAELLEAERARLSEGWWFSSWLEVIRKSRVEWMTVTSSDGRHTRTYQPGEGNFSDYDRAVTTLHISVVPGTVERVGLDRHFKDAATVEMKFSTGVTYYIERNLDTLLILSSDMDYALEYPLEEDAYGMQELEDAAAGKTPVLTAKPVVYLYPERPTDVSVRVDYRGSFSETIPAYRDGWEVTAHPAAPSWTGRTGGVTPTSSGRGTRRSTGTFPRDFAWLARTPNGSCAKSSPFWA